MYGPITPYMMLPNEHETVMLEDERRMMEEALERIKKRLEELKKEEITE